MDPLIFAAVLSQMLTERHVHHRWGRVEVDRIGDVGHDADNLPGLRLFKRPRLAAPSNRDMNRLADGVLLWKMTIGERFVDHGNPRGRRDVMLCNPAPSEQPEAERVERLGIDFAEVRGQPVLFVGHRSANNREVVHPHVHR